MKLLLINPFLRHWTYQVFPLGIGYVAAAARDTGHTVEVLDINALGLSEEEARSRIAKIDYDVAGIGGMSVNYASVKRLAVFLKTLHPDKPVVIGGVVTSGIEKLLLEVTPADVVVSGEADQTIKELLDALAGRGSLKTVKGIFYRNNGNIEATAKREPVEDLDALPPVPYELFPMESYLRHRDVGYADLPAFDIMASRGCPFRCGFCSRVSGKTVRHRSVESVISQMQECHRRFGARDFWFLDESFTVDKGWVRDFCAVLVKLGAPFYFSCSTRVNLLDEGLVALMKSAGCRCISFGVESYNRQVLSRMKKDITPEQIDNAIKLCLAAGINPHITYMFGYPGETLQSIYETVKFLSHCTNDFMTDFFVPLPGSEIYEELRAAGKIPDEDKYLEGLPEHFNTPYINVTDLPDFQLLVFPKLVSRRIREHKDSQIFRVGLDGNPAA
jgi:anaerobic magnesium-protoporphyrin IX monomethyl ester cyclase